MDKKFTKEEVFGLFDSFGIGPTVEDDRISHADITDPTLSALFLKTEIAMLKLKYYWFLSTSDFVDEEDAIKLVQEMSL